MLDLHVNLAHIIGAFGDVLYGELLDDHLTPDDDLEGVDRRVNRTVASGCGLEFIKVIKQIANNGITAKSGIMVGLGERPEEVEEVMDDLLAQGCKILTIGQYLQPTHRHYPVAEYITPDQFKQYRTIGLKKGFREVESAPLVRSSYHAEKHIKFKG